MLSENNFVVWGGDIRDKDSWDGKQPLVPPLITLICILHSCSEVTSDNIPIRRFHSPSTPPKPLIQLVFFHLDACADRSLASPWTLSPRVRRDLASKTYATS